MTPHPARPRCLRLEHWPAADREAWQRGLMPGQIFRTRAAAPRWRPATILKARKSYGVWLSFLMAQDDWDPAVAPAARVTRPRLRAYYWFLREAANRPMTLTGRFDDLARALRVLAPGEDWAWVRRPDGQAIRTLQPQTPRAKPLPPDTGVLAAWACEMMDTARAGSHEPAGWVRYRDGLFIALLAWRARRVGSMAQLRPGYELLAQPGGYRIELTAEQVKTHKPDRFDLPEALNGYIRHYLDVVRPALLAGRGSEALWIGQHGQPLGAKALAARVFHHTGQRFATRFGPHRFRHALSTTAVLSAPEYPGLAAALLGISEPVIDRHYNLAGQVALSNTFANQIAARRKAYADEAERRRLYPPGKPPEAAQRSAGSEE